MGKVKVITKRKKKDMVLKGITFAACFGAISSLLMFAFERPRPVYAVVFVGCWAWCACFAYANGGGRCER